MRRRELIAWIGGTAALAFGATAQQPVPTVAFVNARPAAASQRAVAAFRKGLGETGYVEDRHPSTAQRLRLYPSINPGSARAQS